MRKILPLLAALAAACLMTPAQAQTSGGYLGVGVMSVWTDNAKDFASVTYGFGGSGADTATGLKVYGGYVWPNRFGIEVGYYDLGSYDVKDFGAKTDQFEAHAVVVSGVFAAPIGRNFDFNAKLGIAFTNVDYTCVSLCGFPYVNTGKSGTAGVLGVGLGWRLAPNFSLRADYEYFGGVRHAVGNLEADYDYGAVSLSAQLKF